MLVSHSTSGLFQSLVAALTLTQLLDHGCSTMAGLPMLQLNRLSRFSMQLLGPEK